MRLHRGPFSKNPAGEPAEEPTKEHAWDPAEKSADWAERLRGPVGERLGLVVPFKQPAHILSSDLCLDGS